MGLASQCLLAAVPGPGLLFGLMLLSAIVGGYAARLVHVPRVLGFLVGGVVLQTIMQVLYGTTDGVPESQTLQASAEPLKAIKDLALGLILFTIGNVFERSKFRATGPRILKLSAAETGLASLFVFAGCGVVAIVLQPAHGIAQNLMLALLLGTAAIATAPAATLFVLQEYSAKGPATDAILTLTGLNNIICIVVFYSVFLILASFGWIQTAGSVAEHVWLALALTTVGSIALGVVSGTVISILHAKLPLAEMLLFFFALFILLGAGEKWLWQHRGVSYNFLLTVLVAGAVFANVAIDSQKLESTLRTVGAPIFAGFFVMAGYGLHLRELVNMGVLGAAYILCRSAGKVLGCHLGIRWGGAGERVGNQLGTALLCQAAVVIGLASFVEETWDSELAAQFAGVVLGSVVLFELIGPLLLKRCVVQTGEVKVITLLSRANVATEGASIVRITLQSLGRLVGLRFNRRTSHPDVMRVGHIMRTNVHFIRASETFNEVLHFIEHSTYSHFPVVDENGNFTGTIHFSDVRDVIYDPYLSRLVTAVDLVDPDSPTVPMDLTLTDLLEIFTNQNVGVLPVVERSESKRVVGVVEQRDLLRALHLPKDSR